MTYLPESLILHDNYINSAICCKRKFCMVVSFMYTSDCMIGKYYYKICGRMHKRYMYLIIGLFTVNSITLDVIHLPTLLYIVGATVSDFGLLWDLLAEIDFLV